MPNEIYHRSEWGNPKAEGFGDVYFDPAATNKLYNHSDNYENSDGTDKILRDIPNKASIVLTPTAYSDGSLNTVIPPYQVLPQELVTNGTFDTDSDWIKGTGWSISDGKASCDGTQSGFVTINQSSVVSLSKIYKVTFKLVVEAGSIRPEVGSSGLGAFINSSGTFTQYIKQAGNTTLYFKCDADFIGSIDNVSVKEVQEADFDFSRGSSATRVNEKGLIEDVASGIPRIDYTSGQGALLLETQSTNLITYSEDFSQWGTVNGAVVTDNFTTSPDGTQNAAKVVYDGTSLGRIEISTGASGTNTQSIYLKTVSGTQVVSIGASSSDLTEVTVTSEWKRFTHTGSGSYPRVLCNDAATIYAWGAQLEQGSYPTSYIPTNGSTVTRSADVANNSGNADLFNDSEGVLFAEIASLNGDEAVGQMSVSNGSDNETVKILWLSANQIRVETKTASGTNFVKDITVTRNGDFDKLAIQYKSNDYRVYFNGISQTVSQVTNTPSGLIKLNFDRGDGASVFYGNVKSVAVFKEALTDAELESLTSWVSFTEMATDLEYTLE